MAQVNFKPERPTEFWPISIAGWIAIISGVSGWFVALKKANNKPILDAIERAEKEMGRIERDFKETIERLEREFKETAENLEQDFVTRINGIGGRVASVDEESRRNAMAIGDQANRLIRSEEDRKQLNSRLGNQEGKSEAAIVMIQNVERGLREKMDQQANQLRDKIDTQTKELMQAIYNSRDGRKI